MKLIKNAGKGPTVRMSKSEWADIGNKAGWMRMAAGGPSPEYFAPEHEVTRNREMKTLFDLLGPLLERIKFCINDSNGMSGRNEPSLEKMIGHAVEVASFLMESPNPPKELNELAGTLNRLKSSASQWEESLSRVKMDYRKLHELEFSLSRRMIGQ